MQLGPCASHPSPYGVERGDDVCGNVGPAERGEANKTWRSVPEVPGLQSYWLTPLDGVIIQKYR